MSQRGWPTIVASFLVCMLTSAPRAFAAGDNLVTPQSPPTNYLFCTASEPEHESADETRASAAIYYSAPFVTVGHNTNEVSAEFKKFLQEKYAFRADPDWTSQIFCYDVRSAAEAETTEKGYLANDKKKPDLKVVETGWKSSLAVH